MATRKLHPPLVLDEAGPSSGLAEAMVAARPAANVTELPVAALKVNPNNPVHRTSSKEELEGLALSIKASGVLTPPVVAPDVDGSYIVLDGNRRLAAAILVGLEQVPVVVRADLAGKDLEVILGANSNRLDLTAMEQAEVMGLLVSQGYTQEQIAGIFGVGQSQVSRRLALLGLPASVKALIVDGLVTPADAYNAKDELAEILDAAVEQVHADGETSFNLAVWQARAAADQAARKKQLDDWAGRQKLQIKLVTNWAVGKGAKTIGSLDKAEQIDNGLLEQLSAEHRLGAGEDGKLYELARPVKRPAKESARKQKSAVDLVHERAAADQAARWPFVKQAVQIIKGADRNKLLWLCLLAGGIGFGADAIQVRDELASDAGLSESLDLDHLPLSQLGDLAWMNCVAAAEERTRTELETLPRMRGVNRHPRINHLLIPAWLDLLTSLGYQQSANETGMLAGMAEAWAKQPGTDGLR